MATAPLVLILESITDTQRKEIIRIYQKQEAIGFFQSDTDPDIFHLSRQTDRKKSAVGLYYLFSTKSVISCIYSFIKFATHIFFIGESRGVRK